MPPSLHRLNLHSPDTVSIHDYPEYLNIITVDDVKRFDPDDRGELLSVKTITQSKFAIQYE